jgi:hypothetical protein
MMVGEVILLIAAATILGTLNFSLERLRFTVGNLKMTTSGCSKLLCRLLTET